ncbi:MAG TPA: hypothetical protein VNO23_06760 [Candidatus Binatia bacterium]|nr:hypothetical protein [Candidatus Binatia bacterium]
MESIRVSAVATSAVTFGLANGFRAFDQAFRLVHDQYVRRHYTAPHPSGRHVPARHRLGCSRVFVAEAAGDIVGTVTLIEDSEAGLPMDEIYAGELRPLRRARHRIAEVSSLATRPSDRAAALEVLMGLMRLLVIYAAELAWLDDLCIAVNPRHAPFYTRVLQFRPFGPLRSFPRVNGAPAVGLRLELDLVRNLIRIGESGHTFRNEVYRFFFARSNVQEAVRRLVSTLPGSVLTPSQLAALTGEPDSRAGSSRTVADPVLAVEASA